MDMSDIYDADTLIASYEEIRKPIHYKYSVQNYGMNLLTNVSAAIKDHEDGTTVYHKGREFTMSERGKIRHITPTPFNERVPIHALCKEILIPTLRPKLIYDNCASLKQRGIDMQRDRLAIHLERYFHEYHTNKGWILIGDFSKYFDNIDHEILLKKFAEYFPEDVIDEVKRILKVYEVDGSVMTDAEFQEALEGVYDSKKFYHRHEKISEDRTLKKSMGIGSEVSQITGVFLPTPVDNYVKCGKGCKYYGRYNDDFYCIHPDKEFLMELLEGIKEICGELHIHLNLKKTRFVRLDKPFVFLKVRYTLTDTGKVVRSFLSPTFIRERRKLHKYRIMVDEGRLPFEDVLQQYKSWHGHIVRKKHPKSKNGKPIYSNYKSVQSMNKIFRELFKQELKGRYRTWEQKT